MIATAITSAIAINENEWRAGRRCRNPGRQWPDIDDKKFLNCPHGRTPRCRNFIVLLSSQGLFGSLRVRPPSSLVNSKRFGTSGLNERARGGGKKTSH